MSLLLDLIYLLGVLIASPWIVYRLTRTRGWRFVPERLGLRLGPPTRGAIWLHGSSVGEVSLLKPLVALLERNQPEAPILISAYTNTGLETARKSYGRHRVMAFPLDLSFVTARFFAHFQPRLVVIVEADFWPNFLKTAAREEVPVAVVNARISEKSFRIHARIGLLPRLLKKLPLLAAQTTGHAERLISLGALRGHVEVTGNMKYDLADNGAPASGRGTARAALGYSPADIVIVGGSLHDPEDRALLESFRSLGCADAALIVVPRYPASAEEIRRRARTLGFEAVLKTAVDRGEARAPGKAGILIVDTVGQLRELYSAADIAFVGGSLFYRGANKGGHNLMEPAILGLPVLFGPYNFSFKETVEDLLAADAGILVQDEAELRRALARLVVSSSERVELGRRAREVVLCGQGATERNYDLIAALLASQPVRLQRQALNRTMPQAANDADIE